MAASGHPFSNGRVHVHFLDFEVAIANFHLMAVMAIYFEYQPPVKHSLIWKKKNIQSCNRREQIVFRSTVQQQRI